MGSIPGLGRSPGGGHSKPLQYSCLDNLWTGEPGGLLRVAKSKTQLKWLSTRTHQYSFLENHMDRGAWQAAVHGVTEESDMTAIKQQSWRWCHRLCTKMHMFPVQNCLVPTVWLYCDLFNIPWLTNICSFLGLLLKSYKR